MKDHENGEPDIFHMECDVKNWMDFGVRWKTVNSDRLVSICDGVSVIDLKSGHSFGMLALKVDLECGTFLFGIGRRLLVALLRSSGQTIGEPYR